MRKKVKSINQKLKQSPNESITAIFGETQKTHGYLNVCLIVIIKTVNYVHYVSNYESV